MNEFRFFDFAIFPDREGREKDGHRLLVLAGYNSHGDSQTTLYSLVDIFIRAGSMDINAIHPISCYLEPPFESLQRQTFKPRVFLPRPIHTAFVVFDNAVVLVSLAEIETSPGSHLQLESHLLSDPYQDVVYLKQGVEYHIVGCAVELAERYERSSSIIFAVHSFGLNRMAAFPAKEGQSVLERAAINIRSRMEQNIFFGGLPHNLLDFRLGRQHAIYTDEEVDAAALEINKSILTSKSRYIPAITPSMDHQLKLRAVALADLIKFASQFHMKASTRWQLLWSAEKMATARAIWQSYSSNLASKDSKRRNLLPELLDMLCEDFKNENRPERGETDIVRHYLIHDISRIQMIVPWAQQAVEELYVEGVKDLPQQAYLISQANDIQICAMEAAFRFRETNAEQYGIPGESIVDGVYQGPYDDLPAIWTSIPETVVKVKELADLSREMAIRGGATDEEENGLSLVLLRKLAEDSPRLVHICCQVYEERCRWLNSRPDPERRAKGERLEATYAQVRHDLIVKLADIELSDEGVKLAEKYQDMQSLVDVLSRSTDLAMERLDAPGGVSDSEDEEINLKLALNKEKSESYFKTFGKKWADALFAKEARFGKASDLIGSNENIQPYFTQYLRERPSLARLGWINEVAAHSDFVRAANDLFVAQQQESNLWSKKVEVSLGKLALLAAEEQNEVSDAHSATKIRQAENGLAVMVIQEQLYEFIRPAIALAIDETAEVEIAMKTFGHAVREKPALQEVLTQDIERIVSRIVLGLDDLVDSMTLMNDDPKAYTRSAFSDRRFFLAFKLLQMAGMADRDPAGKELQDKMIWRRCMIQDDWEAINRTELKDDNAVAIETEATALFRTLKAGFQEGMLLSSHAASRDFSNTATGFFDRVPLPSPSSVLGAGTTTAGLRASSRYANAPDSVVEALAKDHGLEDQELDRALERGRLAMWWAGIVDGARASVGADADSAGEEMARTEERRRVLDERLGTGQVPTMGTYASAFLDDVDGEGDVVML
jgi:nuclear pore complex protein Nup133